MSGVGWFFMIGGFLFLLAALFLREFPQQGAQITALTFTIIGFFWIAPQLVMMWVSRRKSGR